MNKNTEDLDDQTGTNMAIDNPQISFDKGNETNPILDASLPSFSKNCYKCVIE